MTFCGKSFWPGQQRFQIWFLHISFFVHIPGYLFQQIFEIVIRVQVVQLCCFRYKQLHLLCRDSEGKRTETLWIFPLPFGKAAKTWEIRWTALCRGSASVVRDTAEMLLLKKASENWSSLFLFLSTVHKRWHYFSQVLTMQHLWLYSIKHFFWINYIISKSSDKSSIF